MRIVTHGPASSFKLFAESCERTGISPVNFVTTRESRLKIIAESLADAQPDETVMLLDRENTIMLRDPAPLLQHCETRMNSSKRPYFYVSATSTYFGGKPGLRTMSEAVIVSSARNILEMCRYGAIKEYFEHFPEFDYEFDALDRILIFDVYQPNISKDFRFAAGNMYYGSKEPLLIHRENRGDITRIAHELGYDVTPPETLVQIARRWAGY